MQIKIRSILVLSILLLVSLTSVASADEQKIDIMYIAYSPDTALEKASQNASFAEDINYIYIPSYNTTSWGPSNELIEAANTGLLDEQNVIFTDMLSSGVFDPMDTAFEQAHDVGVSLLDINSADTPSYFDYVSDGNDDDTICNLYNNMGIATEEGRLNAELLLKYLAQEYGNDPQITDEWDKIRIFYIGYLPDPALQMAANTNRYRDIIEYTYVPSYNTTSWGPSDELIEAAKTGLLDEQNIIFTDMLSSGVFDPMDTSFEQAHDSGVSLLDINSADTPSYFDYISDGNDNDTICNMYNNMGIATEEETENTKDLLIYLASEYGNRADITDDWNKVNILYVAYSPSEALKMASEISEHSDDIKFTYIPSYNTTSWGPSDGLIEAADELLLEKQDVIFFDMLSSGVYDPIADQLLSTHDSGVSFVDIRSSDTPEYFDYVSNGSIDDPICNYYNSMGTETEVEKQNAENLLEYIAVEYGNKEEVTDNWANKIRIMYIAYTPDDALQMASLNNIHSDEIEYIYVPSYNTSSWGPSDELIAAADSGLLEEQDIIFCDMLAASIYDPIADQLLSAHNNNVSFVDIRSSDTPSYFDYVSNGSIDDPICNYYNSMGTENEVEKQNAENLLIYLAKEYGDHPEITDKWITIKIMYIAYTPNAALQMASEINPYSQNIDYTYIPSYNTTSWGPSDELIAAAEGGLLEEQDVIFTDMLASSIFEPIDLYFSAAHNKGTILVDIVSSDTPEYFDYAYNGSENNTLCNYYNNMGTATTSQLINAQNLLIYLAKELGINPDLTDEWEYVELGAISLPAVGLYHPNYEGRYFETTEEYLAWYADDTGTHRIYDPSKPTIGMWMHRSDIKDGNTEVVDALIADIESKDCNVIMGFDTFDDIIKYYCNETGEPLVQSVISMKSFRLNYWNNTKGLQELEALDVPVLRGIIAEETTSPDPADANRGIPNSQVVRKTIGPNVDGIFEFIVIGKSVYDDTSQTSEFTPMDEQIEWIANRSINWAELKLNENKDKKVAIIYYNYPSGKDNIGASYLNVIESTRLLLEKMEDNEFNVTGVPENDSLLLEMIQEQGINAGSWAPGVMNEMVENKTEWGLQLIPMETYHEWFEAEIPDNLKEQVITEWGEPWSEELPQNKSLMIWENETGSKFIVIPTVQFGDVWIMPQPARGFLQNDDALYHSSLVPPPHQYIAFYLWLNDEWEADAVIHLGTHGTHEWLPGQTYGLNRSNEWAPVLLQDLPNIYPYIVANVGEGLTAEYRGNALIIDHLTPTLGKGGIYGELGNVSRYIQQYYGPELDERTKKAYQDQIIKSMVEANLDSDLDVDAEVLYSMDETNFSLFVKNVLHEYIEDISSENIPFGLHTLGEVPSINTTDPESDELSMMVWSMMGSYFDDNVTAAYYPENEYPLGIPLNDTKVQLLVWEVITNGTSIEDAQILVYNETNASVALDLEFGLTCRQNLLDSSIEMDRIIHALSAGFIPAGPGTDPIMNTDAVPTGRNFYGVNPELYPSKATWEIGKTLAQDMIDQYYQKYGEYPTKVAFSRFGVEFIRDHGTLEAEALYLLGVQPVWDKNGKVTGVELIPEEDLLTNYNSDMPGRPRIDIVYATAGMRDAFPDKLKMLDEAVRLANTAEQGEYPNYVNESTQAIYQALYENFLESMNETEAHELATTLSTMRCFAVKDGTYEIAVGNAVSASGTWDNESEIAELYIDKMGYAYGTDLWGYDASELLRENLRDVDAAVHSDNSNLYDTLDNDDFYQYFGGLSLAIEYVSGKAPELFVSSGKDPTNFEVVPFKEYFMENIRSRYMNPSWIEGMMGEGYSGAAMFSSAIEYLWGWDVTTGVVSDELWEEFYQTYVNDPIMKEFFEQHNPHAYQSITGRMLEAARMGYWEDIPESILSDLVEEHMDSVAEHDASCCHHTCGNILNGEYVQSLAIAYGVPDEKIEKFNKEMYDATGQEIYTLSVEEMKEKYSDTKATDTVTEESENDISRDTSGNYVTRSMAASSVSNESETSKITMGEDLSMNPEDALQSAQDNYIEGYEMTKESVNSDPEPSSSVNFSGADILGMVLVIALLGIIAAGFRKRKF